MRIMQGSQLFVLALIASATSLASSKVSAEVEQNWLTKHIPEDADVRIGIGLFASHFPDYPGSAQNDSLVLPFPFFSYYSETLEVDGSEAVGRLFSGELWEFNLNFSGAIPTRSNNNARDGMNKLGWVGELGPSMDFAVRNTQGHKLYLRFPVRVAIAADGLNFQYLGMRFDPQIRNRKWFNDNLEWDTTIALTWSESKYHQFFYGVSEEFRTDDRPFYEASGGYSGLRVSTGLSLQLNRNWWIGGFVRYQKLDNTAFADSPLRERNEGWSIGFAVARILYEQ